MPSTYRLLVASTLLSLVCTVTTASDAEASARALSDAGKNQEALSVLAAAPPGSMGVSARTLQVYLLTDAQQFAPAVSLGSGLAKAEPKNIQVLLSYAYALRHSGNKAEALKVYQEAAALDPTNTDALTGQVLMLGAVGAPILALELATSNKLALPQSTVTELRHAQAIQLIRLAPSAADQVVERKASLDNAISILRDLSVSDRTKVPDLIAALSRNNEHAEALRRYEMLGTNAPVWLWPDISNSYAAKKDFKSAVRLLEGAVSASPDEPEYWSALFYLYSDIAEATKAEQLMDATVKRCEASNCPHIETALTLQIYSRLWASDTRGAKKLVHAALAKRPTSTDLKSAYVAVLTASGLKSAAREQVKALADQRPEVLDFKLSKLSLEDAQSNAAEFDAELQALEMAFPGNAQVARLRSEWALSRAAVVKTSFKVAADENSSTTKTELNVKSAALTAQGIRLLAETASTRYKVGALSGVHTSGSVGLEVPLGFSTTVQGHITALPSGSGIAMGVTNQWSDALSLDASVGVNADAVPYKALPFGTKVNVASAHVSYQIDESNDVGGGVRAAKLSDSNQQVGVSLSQVHRGTLTPDWSYNWTQRVGRDTSSKQDVSYFSPRAETWAESELSFSRRYWLSGNTFVTVQPHASLGLAAQRGFATLPFYGLGTDLRFSFGPRTSLDLQASLLKKPFDGDYSLQTLFGLLFTWTWP